VSSQPLAGLRVVVTRPENQAGELADRLRALGAEPLLFPTIAIVPSEAGGLLDQAIDRLSGYDWVIFTSVNGVENFWAHLQPGTQGLAPLPHFRGRVAAIGPATADVLRQRGVLVDLMPDEYRAEAILGEIGDVAGQRILLPRADIARRALADGLRARGAWVDEAPAYRTVRGKPSLAAFEAMRAGVDVVTFTSSSTVHNFVYLTQGLDYGDPIIVCIGPVTAATAHELGLSVDVEAETYTIDGLLESLISKLQTEET
jgi:uroporphyrinogen-III synthase